MHKGFPELLSYILGKPAAYSSHSFVTCSYWSVLARVLENPRGGVWRLHPSMFFADHRKVPAVQDYAYRPELLQRFPFNFFVSACEFVGDGLLPGLAWYTYPTGAGGQVRRHPAYAQGKEVKSRVCPELSLLDAIEKKPLHHYPYYLRLLVDKPWKVPVLYGALPPCPDDQSSITDKGHYAAFLMLLFRPWRCYTY